MPQTLTGTPALTDFVVPVDGDFAGAESGDDDAPLEDAFQAAADHSKYIRDGLAGFVAHRVGLYSTNGVAVFVQPLRLFLNGEFYTSAVLNTGSLSGLTANTWYYVYAYVTGGALALEYSTTAPNAAGNYAFKDSAGSPDTSHRYLGCFRARTTTHCYPFRASGGRYVWRRSADGLTTDSYEFTLPSSGAATSWADVDVSGFFPPHASLLLFDAEFKSRSANDDVAELCSKGDAAQAWRMTTRSAAGTNVAKAHGEIVPAGVPLGVSYQVSHASDALRLFAVGFEE